MRIYLIGFMGSGKTTVGRNLAKRSGFEFIDLDDMIETKCKATIPVLFQKYDEHAFRIIERESLAETAGMREVVIATGGGTPCFFENMKWMNDHGVTIYLKLDPVSLIHRLQASRKVRPLLKGKSETEITDYVIAKLTEREPFYNKADIIVKGESLKMKNLLSEIESSNKNIKS
jgi:shikimate kinase